MLKRTIAPFKTYRCIFHRHFSSNLVKPEEDKGLSEVHSRHQQNLSRQQEFENMLKEIDTKPDLLAKL